MSDPSVFVGARPLGPADVLLGRDDDIRRLRNLLLVDRVVLLYGSSGTGKTSLLEAADGLRVHLCADNHFNPIKRFYIGEYLAGTQPSQPLGKLDEDLQNFIRPPKEPASERQEQTERYPLAIIDQIERCWQPGAGHPGTEPGLRLVHLLRQCILDFPRSGFLLVVQEEYLAPLLALRQRLPGQLSISYRLEALTPEQARAVIAGPPGRELPGPIVAAMHALGKEHAVTGQDRYDPLALQLLGRMLEERCRGLPWDVSIAKAILDTQIASMKERVNAKGLLSAYLEEGLEWAVRDISPGTPIGLLSQSLQQQFLEEGSATRKIVRLLHRHTRWARLRDWFLRLVAVLLRYGWPGRKLPLRSIDLQILADPLHKWGILRLLPSATSDGSLDCELAHDRLAAAFASREQLVTSVLRERRFWLLLLFAIGLLAGVVAFVLWLQAAHSEFQGPSPTSLHARQLYLYPLGAVDRIWPPPRELCERDLQAEGNDPQPCAAAMLDAQAKYQAAQASALLLKKERDDFQARVDDCETRNKRQTDRRQQLEATLAKERVEHRAAIVAARNLRPAGERPVIGPGLRGEFLDSLDRKNLKDLCDLIRREGVEQRLDRKGVLAMRLPQLCSPSRPP